MSRRELELMWEFKRVLGEAGEFVVIFSDGDMDAELVLAFAKELRELAEQFRRHAVDKLSTVNGEVVIEQLALPAGESSISQRA